jgi:alanine dehydrogenase
VLPKPLASDLEAVPARAVVWGWPHCVQDEAITQVAIDRRLTLIAWEAMNHWTRGGAFSVHVFHKNNEFAGLLLGPARAADRGYDGGVRPPAARGGDQLLERRRAAR